MIINMLPYDVVKDNVVYLASDFPCEVYVDHQNVHYEKEVKVSNPKLSVLGLPKALSTVKLIVSPEVQNLKNKRTDLITPDYRVK